MSDLEQWERLVCPLIVSAENLSKPACSEHIDYIQKVFLYSQVEVGAPPGVTAILLPFDAVFGYKKHLPDLAILFTLIRIKIK